MALFDKLAKLEYLNQLIAKESTGTPKELGRKLNVTERTVMLIGQLAGFLHFRMLKVKINLLLFAPSALFNKRATKRHQTQLV